MSTASRSLLSMLSCIVGKTIVHNVYLCPVCNIFSRSLPLWNHTVSLLSWCNSSHHLHPVERPFPIKCNNVVIHVICRKKTSSLALVPLLCLEQPRQQHSSETSVLLSTKRQTPSQKQYQPRTWTCTCGAFALKALFAMAPKQPWVELLE